MRNDESGLSLVGTLVASAILMITASAAMDLIGQAHSHQAGIGAKFDLQTFRTLLTESLSSPRSCSRTLLEGRPLEVTIPPELAPLQPVPAGTALGGTPSNDLFVDVSLPSISLGSTSIVPGNSRFGKIRITGLNLRIRRSTVQNPQSRHAEAIANLEFERAYPGVQKQHSFQVPIVVDVEQLQAGRERIRGCVSQTTEDSASDCERLGGRWLVASADDPGSYMPTPRCSFGRDLNLAFNEAPAEIPRLGGINSEGEFVERCHYHEGTIAKSLTCRYSATEANGNRCAFDTESKTWKITYIRNLELQPWRYYRGSGRRSPIACSKGVTVSSTPPGIVTLEGGEPLSEAWSGETWNWAKEISRSSNLLRCQIPNGTYRTCKNANDPGAALDGKAGSCTFVRGVTGISGASGPYTGWIHVGGETPRQRRTLRTNPYKMEIASEKGIACENVELSTQIPYGTLNLKQDPLTAELVAAPERIKTCVHQAAPAVAPVEPTAPAEPGAAGPSAFFFADALASLDFGQSVVRVGGNPTQTLKTAYLCQNGEIESLGLDADESLPRGTCVYAYNIKLERYSDTSSRSALRNISPGDSEDRYTGWVTLTDDVEFTDATWLNGPTRYGIGPNTAVKTIKAIPCTAGVIVEDPTP